MRYLLLIYSEEEVLTDAVRQKCYRESAAVANQLKSTGQYLGSAPLQTVATATTVKVRDGKRMVTDGPFAETREQLGGFFMIEAKNLDEAIEIAGRIPGASIGTIEIRPVIEVAELPAER